MSQQIDSFVATLDELLRFLDSYQSNLFYMDINPKQPPAGARHFEITTFSPTIAERVIDDLHPGPGSPRLTPGAKSEIEAARNAIPFGAGMNIHPKNGQGLPQADANLAKMDWVRFPFICYPGAFNPSTLEAAYAFFDPVIDAYNRNGVKILLILTAEVYGAGSHYNLGAMNSAAWSAYTRDFAAVAEQIIRHYGNRVHAYEIWNEGDAEAGNPTALHFPPRDFAPFLDTMSRLVRTHAPQSKVVLGGLVMGAGVGVKYIADVKSALGGKFPVDAVGIHPYGKGAPGDTTPFARLGSIAEDIRLFKQAVPNIPLWITEIGALGANTPDYWDTAAQYMKKLYTYLRQEQSANVPVVIWYAWSDAMDGAARTNGLIAVDGRQKPQYSVWFNDIMR